MGNVNVTQPSQQGCMVGAGVEFMASGSGAWALLLSLTLGVEGLWVLVHHLGSQFPSL